MPDWFKFGQDVSKIVNGRDENDEIEELEIRLAQKCAQLDAALEVTKELRESVGLDENYRDDVLTPRYQELIRYYSRQRSVQSVV